MELEQRVVLVTGAARRVGAAIAQHLAREGMHVALHCHRSRDDAERTAATCRTHGVQARVFAADLAEPQAPPRLIEAVLETFGRLDVLINNAAVFEPMSLENFELDRWQRTLQVNLTAPLQLAHAARQALSRDGGRVINLCDAATPRAWSDHLAYIVSKGAMETLTRALARAMAPQVNVLGVAPGIVAWPASYDEPRRRRLLEKVPLQRAGTPQDVAALVSFLLREGDYLTGCVIPLDGGRHLS